MGSLRKFVLVVAMVAVVAGPTLLTPSAAEAGGYSYGGTANVANIWSAELYYYNAHARQWTLYTRYFVTANTHGQVTNWGGMDYAWNSLRQSGYYVWAGNYRFVRTTYNN